MAKGLIWILALAGGAALALTASCVRNGSLETRFVPFYADVVVAQRTAVDSAAAAESALVVARRHHISPSELSAFREEMKEHPEKWVGLWEQVLERVREMEPEPARSIPG